MLKNPLIKRVLNFVYVTDIIPEGWTKDQICTFRDVFDPNVTFGDASHTLIGPEALAKGLEWNQDEIVEAFERDKNLPAKSVTKFLKDYALWIREIRDLKIFIDLEN